MPTSIDYATGVTSSQQSSIASTHSCRFGGQTALASPRWSSCELAKIDSLGLGSAERRGITHGRTRLGNTADVLENKSEIETSRRGYIESKLRVWLILQVSNQPHETLAVGAELLLIASGLRLVERGVRLGAHEIERRCLGSPFSVAESTLRC